MEDRIPPSPSNSQLKWVQTPRNAQISLPYILARAVRPLDNNKVEYSANYDNKLITVQIQHHKAFQSSDGANFPDMCEMAILNEPQVLNNLIRRYNEDEIFTYIGPTLIVINPYKLINRFFSKQAMLAIRDKILADKIDKQHPHVYMIAGKAYKSMLIDQDKQAIVISGESGAGKTESTKYCMQLLTALSHKETHPIEGKILSCNPLLEAFGNSKTIRNDNSSRFGKYVRIFFGSDNTIKGATINSYLLEKSRVTSIALNERSFHIFYALTAAGVQGLQSAQKYTFLAQSKCYTSSHENDHQYFHTVSKSMDDIGFKKEQKERIWKLIAAILMMGNIQFDDKDHLINQSTPCSIKNRENFSMIAKSLNISEEALQKVLIFEKKKFLKQFTSSPYNKQKCIANRNTLCKAIYNTIFQFIIHKVEISLRPEKNMKFKSISILDIFGFQNFVDNSFEQLCINFTNQKLLKLYNQYVFQRQMLLLKEDGLGDQIQEIKPPTNDNIINAIGGKLSLFSIINDLTMPQQYKDQDMVAGFNSKLKNAGIVEFDKHHADKFMIKHSQCDVMYSAKGFKVKNQDKVIAQIQDIVNSLFQHKNLDHFGKTLLNKFNKDIDNLMNQLQSSKVNFVRCIKPNQKKTSGFPDHQYILSQVRYLGVFETIQIRKKTFPSRKTYKQFYDLYSNLYPGFKSKSAREGTIQILKRCTDDKKSYLLGNVRVYINEQIEIDLNKKLYKLLKLKNQKSIIIQRAYKRWRFKKTIKDYLKILVCRIRIWKRFANRKALELQKHTFIQIADYAKNKRKYLEQQAKRKTLEAQRKKQLEQKELKKARIAEQRAKIPQKLKRIAPVLKKIILLCSIKAIKQAAFILEDTIIIEDSNYSSSKVNIPRKAVDQVQSEFHMSNSFLNDQSIYVSHKGVDSVFKRSLTVQFFAKTRLTTPEMQRLKLILAEKFKLEVTQNEEDFFSPNSEDCGFKVEECDKEILKSIITFETSQFLKGVLRKRTNFIGIKKSEEQILIAKPRPMSKSLTLLNEGDEQEALKIFKILVKIGDQSKLENVFKLIESMVQLCKGTSQQLKNEVFLMLLKQSNTPSQLASIRIYQCIAVFLHIYSPENQYLYAAMNIFFQKLGEQKLTQKQQEYVRYLFKKMLRIIHRPFTINYMPIKYQLMALMCKRQISLPVYLPIGNSILIRVQSYHTFADIKVQVMKQFGIDYKRLNPQYFTFFEIVNFQNEELGESPLNENQVVWDVMTYWEKAKDKYKETQIIPPAFFLMLKIRYTFECFNDDQESIQLLFAQCYFDYFIGRIKMDVQQMAILAACIKKIKLTHKPIDDIMGAYPIWLTKDHKKEVLSQLMKQNVQMMTKEGLTDIEIKYKFLAVAQECPLALALAIPTQQPIKLFLKPKNIYLTEKCNILQDFSIRTVVKWAIDKEKFIFDVKQKDGKSRSQAIFTQHAHICSGYLSLIPKLIANGSQNTPILNHI